MFDCLATGIVIPEISRIFSAITCNSICELKIKKTKNLILGSDMLKSSLNCQFLVGIKTLTSKLVVF